MAKYITPRMVADRAYNSWVGDVIVMGDMLPGSTLYVIGNVEVRGNVGVGCTIRSNRDVRVHHVADRAMINGDVIETRDIGRHAAVAGNVLHIHGDIDEHAVVSSVGDIWLEGQQEDSAKISYGGHKYVMSTKDHARKRNARADEDIERAEHAKYYKQEAPAHHFTQKLEMLDHGVMFNPRTRLYTIPVMLLDEKDRAHLQRKLHHLGADVYASEAVTKYGELMPVLIASSGEKRYVDVCIRAAVKHYVPDQNKGR